MATGEPPPFPPDDSNPYAPPQSSLKPEPMAVRTRSIPFALGDVLERTWEIYRDRMGFCIGAFVAYMLLLVLAGVAYGLALEAPLGSVAARVVARLLAIPAFFVFILWITVGLMRLMLDVAQGRETGIGLFGGGRFLVRVVVANLLAALAMLATMAAGALLGGIMSLLVGAAMPQKWWAAILVFAVGMGAGYVASFIVYLRLSQFLYLIVDRDLGAGDSLVASFQITRGHAGELFVLSILGALINLLGMLACGIGLLFTTPYLLLLLAVTYIALSGKSMDDDLQ
jgi:hypothetical protein